MKPHYENKLATSLTHLLFNYVDFDVKRSVKPHKYYRVHPP